MKNKYNLAQAQSAINSLSYESDFTKRNISNEVYEAEALMNAANKKVGQFELHLNKLKPTRLLRQLFRQGHNKSWFTRCQYISFRNQLNAA